MQMLTMQSCVRTTLKNTAASFGVYESYLRSSHSAGNSDVFAAPDDYETASERDDDSRAHGPAWIHGSVCVIIGVLTNDHIVSFKDALGHLLQPWSEVERGWFTGVGRAGQELLLSSGLHPAPWRRQ